MVKGYSPVKRGRIFPHLQHLKTKIAFLQDTHLTTNDHHWHYGQTFHANFWSQSKGSCSKWETPPEKGGVDPWRFLYPDFLMSNNTDFISVLLDIKGGSPRRDYFLLLQGKTDCKDKNSFWKRYQNLTTRCQCLINLIQIKKGKITELQFALKTRGWKITKKITFARFFFLSMAGRQGCLLSHQIKSQLASQ